jgi:hypothetical protein
MESEGAMASEVPADRAGIIAVAVKAHSAGDLALPAVNRAEEFAVPTEDFAAPAVPTVDFGGPAVLTVDFAVPAVPTVDFAVPAVLAAMIEVRAAAIAVPGIVRREAASPVAPTTNAQRDLPAF